MGNLKLDYYMWGYQHFFQSSANRAAQQLFEELLPAAGPFVFLVGVLIEHRSNRLPLCVEPDHGPIQPTAFANLDSVIQTLAEKDERNQMCYSNPIAADRVYERVAAETLGRGIEQCCAAVEGQDNYCFFASLPVEIDGFLVCCVLRLRREEYERQVRLIGDRIGRMSVVKSFIEAVVIEFLAECQRALREPDAGVNLCVVKATRNELLQRGGFRFMKSIAWRAFGADAYSINGLGHVEQLCEAMTSIAAMKYEGDDAVGRFIVCQSSNPLVEYAVHLKSAVSLREKRRIRKLLELARGELSLVVTDSGVIGLAKLTNGDKSDGEIFQIEVVGHHFWRVIYADGVLCEFRYGLPGIARPRLSVKDFSELCVRLLPTTARVSDLWQIVEGCIGQRHGTMLVVSTRAEEEAARLAKQSTLIEPQTVTLATVQAITSIDGALLVDHEGVCHAIGVILDGMATQSGDPGRGARFNSAVRYLEAQRDGCLICIVSEDGDVIVLPQLRERVRRSVVESAVNALVEYAGSEHIKPREFAELRKHVDNYRFYLDEEHCQRINSAIEAIESKEGENGSSVTVIRPLFTHNPEMDDSYWRPE